MTSQNQCLTVTEDRLFVSDMSDLNMEMSWLKTSNGQDVCWPQKNENP